MMSKREEKKKMPKGYAGKILHVDLTSAVITVEEPDESFYRFHFGGSSLNLSYVLKQMVPGTDPLSPGNLLAFGLSAFTGAPVSGLSRMTVTAKSPLTGAIGDSQCGGFWPAKLKFAGFDGIIVTGKSSKPVYLWIDEGNAELRNAEHLWGKTTGESQSAIFQELGDDKNIEVLQIGPAGENLVRYASIMNMCNRANGRTGMGAVMGSKNLKAIAVRGTAKVEVADAKKLKEVVKWGAAAIQNSAVRGLGKYGTASEVAHGQTIGGLPTFNFNSGVFDGWQKIDGETMYNTVLRGADEGKQTGRGRETCYGCIVRCKRVVEIKDEKHTVDPRYGGPEYESLGALGSYCGIDNLGAICKANELCNQFGLDTISCGATIAWAMEAFEAGKLSPDSTGGLDIQFGDADMMLGLIRKIAYRKGFGDVLAEGSAVAAEKLGVGDDFLVTSKGQEAPVHMTQVKRGLALAYAVNPFGSDHMSCDHDLGYTEDAYDSFKERYQSLGLTSPLPATSLEPKKVEFVRRTQYLFSMMDSANMCQFVWGPSWQLHGPEQMLNMIKAVTGWDVTIDELLSVGERRVNMMRIFNAREGIDSAQDTLPEKFFKPLKGGPTDGWKVDRNEFEAALKDYYQQSGWDEDSGVPTKQTLKRLELEWLHT
ncbi:MAG: aldehyde ferredoxin oxidoreductase family protein [Desulfobacterales bacterium]|nr:aldehyde ferredoxin oxidoreductase family protein [Desulfobacterales bacterium]